MTVASTTPAGAEIRGILFDLGDTLLDFGAVDTLDLFEQGAKQTHEWLQSHDQPVPNLATYHRRELRAIQWAYFRSWLTRREFNSFDIMCRLAREMGHTLSEEQLTELAWLWYEPLSKQVQVETGVRDMLQAFTKHGIKLGIVSNTFVPGTVLDRHLGNEGLLPFLPTRVYSCDVRYRKPDRRIFRQALSLLDLPAGQTLFVGDSPKADIYGAAKAGMATALKDPTGDRKPHRIVPDHTISSLVELSDIVVPHREAAGQIT